MRFSWCGKCATPLPHSTTKTVQLISLAGRTTKSNRRTTTNFLSVRARASDTAYIYGIHSYAPLPQLCVNVGKIHERISTQTHEYTYYIQYLYTNAHPRTKSNQPKTTPPLAVGDILRGSWMSLRVVHSIVCSVQYT